MRVSLTKIALSLLMVSPNASAQSWTPGPRQEDPRENRINYISVAWSPQRSFGWSFPSRTPEEARDFALNMCGLESCEAVIVGDHYVVAMVFECKDIVGWAKGRNYDEMIASAEKTSLTSTDPTSCVPVFMVSSSFGLFYNGYATENNAPVPSTSWTPQNSPSYGVDPTSDEAHYNEEECGDWAGC